MDVNLSYVRTNVVLLVFLCQAKLRALNSIFYEAQNVLRREENTLVCCLSAYQEKHDVVMIMMYKGLHTHQLTSTGRYLATSISLENRSSRMLSMVTTYKYK